ncbi:solute carrier family 46 member 3-like [Chrysoperla carnea]|uniref:solute carrier family 46 member 3-like n=1 Tax=Chrysoperla carnea TaxID=189513 RepID=UPI001D071C34|nr:solute carrier family 46 member 3-like [Chrysoperla carnea]
MSNTTNQNLPSKWYTKISVEISISLYMLAFMLTTVFEQAFFVHKACISNHGFSQNICDHLYDKKFENYSHVVQVTVSNYLQWDSLATNIIPMILVLFLGSWSDKYGRKFPLILGLCGKFFYSFMIIINALQPTWPLKYVIYTAVLPMALTGADAAIFSSAYSYLTDITTKKNRTFRISVLDGCYLSTMPIGIAIGRYLFTNVLGKSYAKLFSINAALLAISIIYSVLVLKCCTTENQTRFQLNLNSICEFFNKKHAVAAFKCFTKRKGRVWLLPFMIIVMCYRFQRDERNYIYLFFMRKLDWDYNDFSYFLAFRSTLHVFMLLYGVPFIIRNFKWRDSILIIIGVFSVVISRFIFMFVETDLLFYIGTLFGSFGPCVAPVIRSMISKLITANERGLVFSLISVADNSVPLYSGIIYSQTYNYTFEWFPGAFFLITIASQLIIFGITLAIELTVPKDKFIYQEPIEKNNTADVKPTENIKLLEPA